MDIAEVCPDCGAERPSWMGDSHVVSGARRCAEDGLSVDAWFAKWLNNQRRYFSEPVRQPSPA